MPNTIRKKTWPAFFEKVLSGEKRFEVRLADFKCEEGDLLVLEEWDPNTQEYTGRSITKKVGYSLNTIDLDFLCPQDIKVYGLLVMQLEDASLAIDSNARQKKPPHKREEGFRKCGYEWGCWFGPDEEEDNGC
jgi:hypothetical protein